MTGAHIVHKVLGAEEWDAAVAAGAYTGSSDDERDGFIHLSTAQQLTGTLERHFNGRTGLVVVDLPVTALGDALRWEPSRGGELFPHLYGVLDPAVAVGVRPLPDPD